MKKKIFVFIAVLTAVLAVSVIGASAAAGYKDDFSVAPDEGKVSNYPGWSPYTQAAEAGVTWDEGTIKFEKAADNAPIWNMPVNVSDVVYYVKFDMKMNSLAIGEGVTCYFSANGYRRSVGIKTPTADEWYTYIFLSQYEEIEGEMKMSATVFRKPTDGETWTRIYGPAESVSLEMSAKMMFHYGSASIPAGAAFWVDNVEAHDGLYYSDITVCDNQGNEIASYAAIPDDIESISVSFGLYNALTLNKNMFTDPQKTEALAMLTVLDEKGMMLDCATLKIDIDYFENFFTLELPMGDYNPGDVDGMKLYLLDSNTKIKNVIPLVELR